jgi:predicted HicB family RNase H-like nuclease
MYVSGGRTVQTAIFKIQHQPEKSWQTVQRTFNSLSTPLVVPRAHRFSVTNTGIELGILNGCPYVGEKWASLRRASVQEVRKTEHEASEQKSSSPEMNDERPARPYQATMPLRWKNESSPRILLKSLSDEMSDEEVVFLLERFGVSCVGVNGWVIDEDYENFSVVVYVKDRKMVEKAVTVFSGQVHRGKAMEVSILPD